jgi:hypothetical protein
MIREQRAIGDSPPWIDTYLASMLSRRLRLESPLLADDKPVDDAYEALELLIGMERLRDAVLRDTVLGRIDFDESADRPLPPPAMREEVEIEFDPEPAVESIARRVPRDCGYVRFGRFPNFLWFNHLLEDYGGDLGRLVTTRGFQTPVSNRLQEQLQLRTDALAEVLGEAVISDVALIGRDFFMEEGAAMGVLFEARNTALLTRDLTTKRTESLTRERDRGATLETLEIAGREVTFLSTPDNRIRSFYVIDGDYHLVTTSRSLVESFLATRDGRNSLGQSAEFRHARSRMPLEREDTVFAYFSSWFLWGLVSPHYQVELRRRMQSTTDMDVLRLARLAARGERRPSDTIAELIEQRFLPPGFGDRPDGSELIVADGRLLDSLRGARGYFTPIPDVAIAAVTRTEERRLTAQAEYYATHWKQMDPVFFGIRRDRRDEPGRERIVLDAHIAPFEESKYGWVVSMLGPPTRTAITSAPGDVIHAQAFLSGGLLNPAVPPHHMFVGVQDHVPLDDLRPTSVFRTLQLLRATPGYLGAWPKTGFLDQLPLGLGGGPPDARGYSRLPLGVWRRQSVDGFSVLSFDPGVLAESTPHLAAEELDDEAQLRIRIGDLAETRVSALVNKLYFEQARRTSVGNARFMQTLVQQFEVPIDDAHLAAEQLLDAQLVCTLGGEYQIARAPGGAEFWVSTAWPRTLDYRLPPDYTSPLLAWFRGLEGSLRKSPDDLVIHVELEMQRLPREPRRLEIPLFDFFGRGARREAVPSSPPADTVPPPAAPAE